MKLTILLLLLPFLSHSQYIPVEIEVFRHMARTIDSCKALQSAAEKDSVIAQQKTEIKKLVIKNQNQDSTISYVINEKEECEYNKYRLTQDYTKEIKKKKRGKILTPIAVVGALIIGVVFKHNYELMKD